MAKRRLDTLLVDRGLAESPEKAQALVMAGVVRVNERPAPKAGVMVPDDVSLDVAKGRRFVSRGGDKLEHALETFGIDVSGLVAVDVGSSTGGFTDCLLGRGASRVYAVDVGRGQLDYKLRQDPRVVVMEGVNARDLSLAERADFAVIDVAFISLQRVLPPVAAVLSHEAENRGSGTIVALFKPQFEAMKEEVPRGGVIKAPLMHATLIGRFVRWCSDNGFRVISMTASPILGAEGNREFLFWLRPGGGAAG
ncbi:MAG: TlyA family RNA methyltransferase [Chloroflexi bacterium]|nr:TlyA family RNA methyltransferase [Chloroflexota bacterium]MCI0783829.1 TlyA family RNA methyltransferase [Chloroflexota bacterium]MCI0813503.1 TlyA family RNA methyltransferase [Chloroflexota bacterium]MCI0816768.1 TlyA family RNA methyltransferase [Chloroflexota bacterium]MCI0818724.1 TlyA family RNA methyltransferase [Chloroflexota bacterium]